MERRSRRGAIFFANGPFGRWSKVDCRAASVGCWRRRDACAAAAATPSDGAPTLVPSDGPVGRATSQPPVSQPTSLSPSRSLSRVHVEARARARVAASSHLYDTVHTRACTHTHTPTHSLTHVRTYRVGTRAQTHTHTHTHTHTQAECGEFTDTRCVRTGRGSGERVTRAHAHQSVSFFLASSLSPNFLRRTPASILRGESLSNERHERESEFLARPSRLQCVPKHPRDNLEVSARTHARTTHHQPFKDHEERERGS